MAPWNDIISYPSLRDAKPSLVISQWSSWKHAAHSIAGPGEQPARIVVPVQIHQQHQPVPCPLVCSSPIVNTLDAVHHKKGEYRGGLPPLTRVWGCPPDSSKHASGGRVGRTTPMLRRERRRRPSRATCRDRCARPHDASSLPLARGTIGLFRRDFEISDRLPYQMLLMQCRESYNGDRRTGYCESKGDARCRTGCEPLRVRYIPLDTP